MFDKGRISGLRATGKPGEKLDRFNLSNDHIYEQSKEAKYRIRQTFGAIEVFHSGPARALQLPWVGLETVMQWLKLITIQYKTSLSKAESRAWHRPALQFPVGVTLGFSKLRPSHTGAKSRKKTMVMDPAERFNSTRDLTLAEKGPYLLLEFSVSSCIVERVRWLIRSGRISSFHERLWYGDDDHQLLPQERGQRRHRPKGNLTLFSASGRCSPEQLDFGQPSILNAGDADPYLLGYVDRGKVTQIAHNNLLRAPIWRHQPETTDFLVIRSASRQWHEVVAKVL